VHYQAKLNLVIASLHQFRYRSVAKYSNAALFSTDYGWLSEFGYKHSQTTRTKLETCLALGQLAALRGTRVDHEYARLICCRSYISWEDDSRCVDLVRDLRLKGNYKAFWRHGKWIMVLQKPVITFDNSKVQSELGDARGWYSIWEWLELPEE
jgi:hypothetical protein